MFHALSFFCQAHTYNQCILSSNTLLVPSYIALELASQLTSVTYMVMLPSLPLA